MLGLFLGRGEPNLHGNANILVTQSINMPNHHIAGGDPEKGDAPYDYGTKGGAYEEPFVHGATLAEASGNGGETHRGLKSRHIQFL